MKLITGKYVLLLLLICFALFVANYKPGTFLLGWDSLHPELNFQANLTRSVFSVWQEYRGLGLLDGMAHAANLPHAIFVWLLHFILPANLLRYVFVFLMHFVGGAGMYRLLETFLVRGGQRKSPLAFLGALFYLFNLATIQMFFAPFEVFAVHFAFLPWLTFSLIQYLTEGKQKQLLLFFILSILSLPQAFVPQLFIAYLLQIVFILLAALLRKGRTELVHAGMVLLIIFSTNTPWALPYLYHVGNNAQTVVNAKINQMASENIYLRNKARGNALNVVLLKGFMLDTSEDNGNGVPSFIMEAWRNHTEKITFSIVSLVFFLLFCVGFLSSLLRRDFTFFPFALSWLLAFLFLGNDIWGLSSLHAWLRETSPLFKEAFRFPFTKFVTIFVFSYTIFFTFGLRAVVEILSKYLSKSSTLGSTALVGMVLLLFLYAYPAFLGDFIFNALRLPISYEYFQTIDFFKMQNQRKRMAPFPQASFWNWRFHKDGYRGSGFLWYGVAQPTLDRSFDPWSNNNENYYHELSYALYSKNQELFEKVLEKYQVDWVLVDRNVANPSSPRALFFYELEDMLFHSKKFTLAKTFGNIKIYRVNRETKDQNFVFLAENLPTVGPIYAWNNYDRAYLDHGPYLSSSYPASSFQLPASNVYYPFRSLFTGRIQQDLEFTIENEGETLLFKGSLPKDVPQYYLDVPQGENEEGMLPEVFTTSTSLVVRISKEGHDPMFTIDPASDQTIKTAKNCNQLAKGVVKNEVVEENGKKFVRLTAVKGNNCSGSFFLPNLSTRGAYLIAVEHRNILGKSLFVWLENNTIQKADIETYLPGGKDWTTSYLIQPPMEEDGIAYTLHFENISIGKDKTVNDLASITVQPIPYEFLASLAFHQGSLQATAKTDRVNVQHPNPSLYVVDRKQKTENGKQTLVLSQSFDQGWKAYHIKLKTKNSKLKTFLASSFPFLFGKELKDHVLVNNWANGWLLPSSFQSPSSSIIILYLPQYLEYFGFTILLATFVGLTVRRKIW